MNCAIPLLTAFMLLANPATTSAAELHGVRMPDSMTLEAKTLKLNGIGIRTKTFLAIKVYVAGLYLETRSKNPDQIIASDSVRRLRLQMTHNAPRDKVLAEFSEGIEHNAKDGAALKERLAKFLRAIPKLSEGGVLTVTYVPGKGTTVVATGGNEVSVPGKDFADALFSAWIGKHPLDGDLKKELLGAH